MIDNTNKEDFKYCLTGALPEVGEQSKRVFEFMEEKRDESKEDWFADAYEELLVHPSLGDDIADLRENIYMRCEIQEHTEDESRDEDVSMDFDDAFEEVLNGY